MKKRILMIGGIVLSILLLGCAAYVGGRLLNGQPVAWGGPNLFSGNGPGEVRINVDDIQPAKELPQASADVRGVFDHRQNNSCFVGTGQPPAGQAIQQVVEPGSLDEIGPSSTMAVWGKKTAVASSQMYWFMRPLL